MLRVPTKRLCIPVVALAFLCICQTANARQPEIRNVNIRGLQIGAKTTLAIDGTDLLPAPRVFLDDQALETILDPASTPTRVLLTLPLPDTLVKQIEGYWSQNMKY